MNFLLTNFTGINGRLSSEEQGTSVKESKKSKFPECPRGGRRAQGLITC